MYMYISNGHSSQLAYVRFTLVELILITLGVHITGKLMRQVSFY